jgi:ribonuclease P/MRP protein subunit POP1
VGQIRVFQRLPRHQRRRAASHNTKRLPQAWRQRAIDQMAKDPSGPRETPKSRRSKRRRHGETFEKRKSNGEWLETHVWQAKRMVMIQKWGFKLALHPKDKNFRACYRASKHQCLINDISYYSVFLLKGMDLTWLQHHMDPAVFSLIKTHSDKMLTFDFYLKNQFPFNATGPVHLWSLPETPVLLVHPASKDAVKSALESYLPEAETFEDAWDKMCLFELTGPRSHAILSKVLIPVTSKDANYDTKQSLKNYQVWNTLTSLHSPAALPPGCILSISVQDPRLRYS